MSLADGLDSELESFREQWLSDLKSQKNPQTSYPALSSSSSSSSSSSGIQRRHRQSQSRRHEIPQASSSTSAPILGPSRKNNDSPKPVLSNPAPGRRACIREQGSDYLDRCSFDEPAPSATASSEGRILESSADASSKPPAKRNLVSALDHYEEAMEKEAQGNMGESLQLYRQAYRMDHGVDRRYREKYFPAGLSKPPTVPASSSSSQTAAPASSTIPEKGHATEADEVQSKTFSELLSSFAALGIEPAVPDVEGALPLPCPMADLPDELLTHILHDVAIADVADYVRLSLVCRRLAYLVASEQRIWRRICLGPEFGFSGMHYRWNRAIEWGPLSSESADEQESSSSSDEPAAPPEMKTSRRRRLSPRERVERRHARQQALTQSLLTSSIYPTWKNMFRNRPRIRFDGCYISTVNYVRSGQACTNQPTWGGAPIYIVTYYRYLRFFRDGSLVSLLASDEPADVVHHLTRDALLLHRDPAHNHLPSAVMRLAHRGRWRLSPPCRHGAPGSRPAPVPAPATASAATNHGSSPSGDDQLSIETEGVGSKYIFKMHLLVRSAAGSNKATSPSSRNNKLVLHGFYSYNKLTEDWAESLLKNNKPFIFSRVRSYGLGE